MDMLKSVCENNNYKLIVVLLTAKISVLIDRIKNRIDDRMKNEFTENIVLKYADWFKDAIGVT